MTLPAIPSRLPARRSLLKFLHWTVLPLFVWFLLVTPQDVAAIGPGAVRLHSILGLAFVTLVLVWTAMQLRHGLASRAGPKLTGWARRLHRPLHLALLWGLFGVALTGFLLGLTSSRLLFAGDIVPIAPPLGLPRANAWVGTVHSIEFYGLAVLVLLHAGFHIWRHLHLRDNALRIMVPRMLHRFL